MGLNSFIIEEDIEVMPLFQAYEQFSNALFIAKTDLEKAGVTQYFEFTYELAWKTMKRILKARGKDINSPKPVFREAALEGLISDPQMWFVYLEDRNLTVHTYNKDVANKIFENLSKFDTSMKEFISNVKNLKK